MVLRVKPTPTRLPTNSLCTPMDNTPLHSISSVCHPWALLLVSAREAIDSTRAGTSGSLSSAATNPTEKRLYLLLWHVATFITLVDMRLVAKSSRRSTFYHTIHFYRTRLFTWGACSEENLLRRWVKKSFFPNSARERSYQLISSLAKLLIIVTP